MPVTTSDSIKQNKGQMCAKCAQRGSVHRWLDGVGYVCANCDPRENLVREVPEETPVDRGKG